MMTHSTSRLVQLSCVAATLLLAACASGPKGVRIVNGGTSAYTDKKSEPIRNLSAAEIGQAIIGKNFQYTRKDGSGFVTYNSDGTLTVTDDQKGQSTGSWKVSGDQYCESYGPGKAEECGVFKNTGDAYFAANSRLVEMQI